MTHPTQGLDDIARELQRATEDFVAALDLALEAAIRAGGLLTRAKQLVPEGSWGSWVDEHFPFSRSVAANWMRLFHYRDRVIEAESVTAALASLRGLPPAAPGGTPNAETYLMPAHPEWMREEAVRMSDQGLPQNEIARRLGVASDTVFRWLDPDRFRSRQRELRQRRKAERAALREQERRDEIERRAKAAGGSLAEAYSTLRRHLQELDRAIEQTEDHRTKRYLREARAAAQSAEAAVVRALGLQ